LSEEEWIMTPAENPVDWNQLVAISTVVIACGTIVLAIVAIFGNTVSRLLRRPILVVAVNLNPPHCHKTFLSTDTGEFVADCYYFRALIENAGKTAARNVEVFAEELLRKTISGEYKTVSSFIPMQLIWSNIGTMLYPALHPDAERHCDIFHIVDPSRRTTELANTMENADREDIPPDKAILSFDTRAKANTKGHLQPPGDYHLKIVVTSENTKAVEKILKIETTGDWINDEGRMLREAVVFRVT
jgi:hypothetical protein